MTLHKAAEVGRSRHFSEQGLLIFGCLAGGSLWVITLSWGFEVPEAGVPVAVVSL